MVETAQGLADIVKLVYSSGLSNVQSIMLRASESLSLVCGHVGLCKLMQLVSVQY